MTTENYIMITIYVSIIAIIVIKVNVENNKVRIMQERDEELRLKLIEETINTNKSKIHDLFVEFARKNKKIHYTLYDIEEGGEYLKEYNKEDLNHIDNIIDEEYSQTAGVRIKNLNLKYLNLQKGFDRIMKEMPKSSSNRSSGFDY